MRLIVAASLVPALAFAEAAIPGQGTYRPAVCGVDNNKRDRATAAAQSGLRTQEIAAGHGEAARAGDRVGVRYTGWLASGERIDSTDGRPDFGFTLGNGVVIRGFDEGVAGMRVGGKRRLFIPAALAYGARAVPPHIPANADLVFEVELVTITR